MPQLYGGSDDPRLNVIVRDISGGSNTRQHASMIKPNQCKVLYNADISVPGQSSKRPGLTLLETLGMDSYRKLLCTFEGADEDTTFTAETGQTVTIVNGKLDNGSKKMNATTSLLLDGTGDYATVPTSTNWDLGTSDFSIGMWVRFGSLTNEQVLMSRYKDANNYWYVEKGSNANGNKLSMYFYVSGAAVGNYIMTGAWTTAAGAPSNCAVDTWYYVMFVRNSDDGYIFISDPAGTTTYSQTLTATVPFTASTDLGTFTTTVLTIGSYNVSLDLNGRLEQVTFDKGIARYTDDFTTPTTYPPRSLFGEYGVGCQGFHPVESANTNELLVWHGHKLEGWKSTGAFSVLKSDITTESESVCSFQAFRSGTGSCVMFKNTTDDWMQYDPNDSPVVTVLTDSGNTNPPKEATVGAFFRGRCWLFGNQYAWFSDAYDTDYSTAFNQSTNAYNIPTGRERAVVPIRDTGLIFLGSESIYGLNPSTIPAATDKPEKLLDIGCVAGKTAQAVGDDVLFLAPDGVRGLFRTINDKVQLGQAFPLSYVLKDEYDAINWSYISKATAVWFDNKYYIALPTGSSTVNNQVWVYYPATQAWMVLTGWYVGDWDILNVSGQERLYYITSNVAADNIPLAVHRAWYGYTDNGTAINYQEEGRKEDMGQPLAHKVGGEIEIKANNAGNYDLTISASTDDNDYQFVGILNLDSGDNPLVDTAVVDTAVLSSTRLRVGKFHIDFLEEWRTLQLKIQHNATNAEEIKVYERSVITFPAEYYSEE